jgi:hypothetical protein
MALGAVRLPRAGRGLSWPSMPRANLVNVLLITAMRPGSGAEGSAEAPVPDTALTGIKALALSRGV